MFELNILNGTINKISEEYSRDYLFRHGDMNNEEMELRNRIKRSENLKNESMKANFFTPE